MYRFSFEITHKSSSCPSGSTYCDAAAWWNGGQCVSPKASDFYSHDPAVGVYVYDLGWFYSLEWSNAQCPSFGDGCYTVCPD